MKKLLLISWTIFVFVLVAMPMAAGASENITYLDKLAHFLLFGVFSALLIVNLFDKYRGFKIFLLSVVLGIAYAGLAEYMQSFLPTRTVSELDFVAGSFGVVLFTFFTYLYYEK